MSVARLRVLAPFAAGLAAFFYFAYLRDYPLRLAMVMGAAMMFLGWGAVRTWERMRDLNDR